MTQSVARFLGNSSASC